MKKYDYYLSEGSLYRGIPGKYGYTNCEACLIDGWAHTKDADDVMFGWCTRHKVSEEEANSLIEKWDREAEERESKAEA